MFESKISLAGSYPSPLSLNWNIILDRINSEGESTAFTRIATWVRFAIFYRERMMSMRFVLLVWVYKIVQHEPWNATFPIFVSGETIDLALFFSFSASLATSYVLYANKRWESSSLLTAQGRRRVHIHEHDKPEVLPRSCQGLKETRMRGGNEWMKPKTVYNLLRSKVTRWVILILKF